MAGPPRPSFPSAPSEPSLRRLGVGGSSSSDRPLRAQLVVALVAVLILLAVPLYLWRRPGGSEAGAPAASAAPGTVASIISVTRDAADAAQKDERVKLGPVQRVKCSASAKLAGQKGALCDAMPFFDDALAKAISHTFDCAPKTGSAGTINYVLTIDFTNRRLSVFPGASGTWKGPQARRAATCVERALPAPDWTKLKHQYRYYMIAVMANYDAPPEPAAPMFK